MVTAADVFLWGVRIGRVAVRPNEHFAVFRYDRDFIGSGIEPAPMEMPVVDRDYQFTDLSELSFHGLPGLLADSVPDKFGNALIDAWLTRQGRPRGSFTAVERLCYTGTRGMGALEYRPAIGEEAKHAERLEVDALVALAAAILNARRRGSANIRDVDAGLASILRIGTSAGGARAKVLVAWNERTGELRSGQVRAPRGFGHWLLKLDGVSANGDKEGDDRSGFGRIEYAYHLMARSAGIRMSDCRLLDEGPRAHFMTRRFDRDASGGKIHMLTLGAMAHYDFNLAGAYSYEQAFEVLRRVVNDASAAEELYRRAIFNILAMNCDDHVKNIAFLMDKAGEWTLAPAYDLTFAYNPSGAWTSQHQMTFNGKRRAFTREDFEDVGKAACLTPQKMRHAYEQVQSAISNWSAFAAEAGVEDEPATQIAVCLNRRAKRTRPL